MRFTVRHDQDVEHTFFDAYVTAFFAFDVDYSHDTGDELCPPYHELELLETRVERVELKGEIDGNSYEKSFSLSEDHQFDKEIIDQCLSALDVDDDRLFELLQEQIIE